MRKTNPFTIISRNLYSINQTKKSEVPFNEALKKKKKLKKTIEDGRLPMLMNWQN
jgi:hypothetical protein